MSSPLEPGVQKVRRVVFDIRVEGDAEVIGTGTHERFVIDLPSSEHRLAAKAEQVRAGQSR